MRKSRDSPGLPAEALAMAFREREIGTGHFYRDESLEVSLARQIYRSHPTFTQGADDFVLLSERDLEHVPQGCGQGTSSLGLDVGARGRHVNETTRREAVSGWQH